MSFLFVPLNFLFFMRIGFRLDILSQAAVDWIIFTLNVASTEMEEAQWENRL